MDDIDILRERINDKRLGAMSFIDRIFKIFEYTLILGVILYVGVESEIKIITVFSFLLLFLLGLYSFLFILTLHPYYAVQGDTSIRTSWFLTFAALIVLAFETLIVVGILNVMSKGVGI